MAGPSPVVNATTYAPCPQRHARLRARPPAALPRRRDAWPHFCRNPSDSIATTVENSPAKRAAASRRSPGSGHAQVLHAAHPDPSPRAVSVEQIHPAPHRVVAFLL